MLPKIMPRLAPTGDDRTAFTNRIFSACGRHDTRSLTRLGRVQREPVASDNEPGGLAGDAGSLPAATRRRQRSSTGVPLRASTPPATQRSPIRSAWMGVTATIPRLVRLQAV